MAPGDAARAAAPCGTCLSGQMNSDDFEVELRTGTPPAPGRLMLLEGFLNTWSGELGFDDFETVASTEAWLRGVGVWTRTKRLTRNQHDSLVTFRSNLRAWILDKTAAQPLNDSVAEVTFRAQFASAGTVGFEPTGDAYQRAIGLLTDLIYESQQNGTWDRFKCCELATCGWAFYDSTRSRTKRWCSMKTCGSRHKAREYYKRKRG